MLMNIPKKLIVGNWKMNTTIAEGSVLFNNLRKDIGDLADCDIVLCPPATHLFSLHRELISNKTKTSFKLGVQNISEHEMGPYTGEISASMVKELVDYVIVGHSERRKYFNETDKTDSQKLGIAMRHGLRPILCVGETKQERGDGQAKQAVLDQLNTALRGVTEKELKDLAIAYEPVWAIGTGNFAKPAVVEEMIMLVRNTLAQTYGRIASTHVRVLYGGSVSAQNTKAYLNLQGVDGLFVGGASLNHNQFSAIVKAATSV